MERNCAAQHLDIRAREAKGFVEHYGSRSRRSVSVIAFLGEIPALGQANPSIAAFLSDLQMMDDIDLVKISSRTVVLL